MQIAMIAMLSGVLLLHSMTLDWLMELVDGNSNVIYGYPTDRSKEMGCRCVVRQLLARLSHSTVTDLAKFLGLSTSVPLMIAT